MLKPKHRYQIIADFYDHSLERLTKQLFRIGVAALITICVVFACVFLWASQVKAETTQTSYYTDIETLGWYEIADQILALFSSQEKPHYDTEQFKQDLKTHQEIIEGTQEKEWCKCEKPTEYIERSSATGDKNYTGLCINCGKPIKPPEKEIKELDLTGYVVDNTTSNIWRKLNEVIRTLNSMREQNDRQN